MSCAIIFPPGTLKEGSRYHTSSVSRAEAALVARLLEVRRDDVAYKDLVS